MKTDCTIELSRIVKEFSLEVLNMPENEVLISSTETNRPGLQLAGYYEYLKGSRSGYDLNAVPNLRLGER